VIPVVLTNLRTIANDLNSMEKEATDGAKLQELEQKITDLPQAIVKPGCCLVFEGMLTKTHNSKKGRVRPPLSISSC